LVRVVLALPGHVVVGPQLADELDGLAETNGAARRVAAIRGPVTGVSFIDSPLPTPRNTRPGNRTPSVAKACATIAG